MVVSNIFQRCGNASATRQEILLKACKVLASNKIFNFILVLPLISEWPSLYVAPTRLTYIYELFAMQEQTPWSKAHPVEANSH
jgi:hypothetical protein